MVHIANQTACISLRRCGVFNRASHAAVCNRSGARDLADQTGGGRITGTGGGRYISIHHEVLDHGAGAGSSKKSGVAAGDIQLEGDGMPVAVKGAFEG